MNTPNPLVPQGTFPDSRSKARFRIAFFSIVAAHVVVLGALLLQGCKRTATEPTPIADAATNYPAWTEPTNQPAPPTNQAADAIPTNVTPMVTNVVTPPPETPPTAGALTEHTIAKGESFYTLAKKYHVTSKAIAEANPGVDPTKLKVGRKLKIPPAAAPTAAPNAAPEGAAGNGKTYQVKSGDTLVKVARAHGVTVKALRSANNLRTSQIKVGQKLKIPAKTAAGAATETAPAGTTAPMETAPGASVPAPPPVR